MWSRDSTATPTSTATMLLSAAFVQSAMSTIGRLSNARTTNAAWNDLASLMNWHQPEYLGVGIDFRDAPIYKRQKKTPAKRTCA